MKIKQKITALILTLVFSVAIGVVGTPRVFAAENCAGVETSIIGCKQKGGESKDVKDSGVWGLLLLALNIMTAGVGILAVGGIVYGAILYASASDSAEQVQRAKDTIRNVVIGVVAYACMYVGLNYLIPGGIFS